MKYAQFHGRARRREFWLFVVFAMMAVAVATGVDGFLGLLSPWYYADDRLFSFGRILPFHAVWAGPFTALTSLLLVLPGLAVMVRRLHDSDRSGAWVLLNLIPLLGGVVTLVLMLIDGTPGPNSYGADPKRRRLTRY